jgi:hypothetical protein
VDSLLASATQVTTFRECKRKWFFKSVEKLDQGPGTIASRLGTETDNEQLQPYFKDGRDFDYTRESGYIAASALAFLPLPQLRGVEVQKRIELPSAQADRYPFSFGYLGYIDLWHPDSSVLPWLEGDFLELPPTPQKISGPIPLVIDFKTTSDFKWAKTRETLRTDVQANIYAMYALVSTGAPAVDLAWVYMRTRGARKAKRTHTRLYRDEVAAQYEAIDATGIELVETRMGTKSEAEGGPGGLALPPNPDACEMYGGCPYRAKCNLSPKEKLEFSQRLRLPLVKGNEVMPSTVDLLAGLRGRPGVAAAPTAPPPSPPPQPAQPEDIPPAFRSSQPYTGTYVDERGQPKAVTAATPPPALVVGAITVGINPPEKDLPPAPAVGVTQVAAPAPPAPVAEKPKRGRPAKAKEETPIEETQCAAPASDIPVPSDESVLASIRNIVRWVRAVR